MFSRAQTAWLNVFFGCFVIFLYGPVLSIILLAFQGPDGGLTFPMRGFSLHWFEELWRGLRGCASVRPQRQGLERPERKPSRRRVSQILADPPPQPLLVGHPIPPPLASEGAWLSGAVNVTTASPTPSPTAGT